VQLGVSLSPLARRQIDGHVRLLLAWNRAINLTAITDPGLIAVRHVLDSLSALPLLGSSPGHLLDLGSGGGFPGVPLAATLPNARMTLVESVGKKAAFLEAVVEAAGLAGRVAVRAGRAESLVDEGRDLVLARGVGALADLVELAMPLLRLGGRLVAWKRGDLSAELAAASRAAAVLGALEPVIRPIPTLRGLEGHVLVEVGKAAPTPAGYPRDPAVRRRCPW
jgi:16S rRNA (guanine527-N7)-methyltransferase